MTDKQELEIVDLTEPQEGQFADQEARDRKLRALLELAEAATGGATGVPGPGNVVVEAYHR